MANVFDYVVGGFEKVTNYARDNPVEFGAAALGGLALIVGTSTVAPKAKEAAQRNNYNAHVEHNEGVTDLEALRQAGI